MAKYQRRNLNGSSSVGVVMAAAARSVNGVSSAYGVVIHSNQLEKNGGVNEAHRNGEIIGGEKYSVNKRNNQ